MKQPIFINKEVQYQLDSKGYVVMPFLEAEQVEQLRSIYEEVIQESPAQFHSTSFYHNQSLKEKINQEVERVLSQKVLETFINIKKLGASFLTKPKGIDTKMPVHQDWTVVDESQYASYTIWIPLQNVENHNGALKVLPASHLITATLRSPTLTSEYQEVSDSLSKQLITIPLKAGEAIIFNHALLHASGANVSDSNRIAVTYGIVPKQADLYLYHQNDSGMVEKYLMPDDFFTTYDEIGARPKMGKKIDEFPYTINPITASQLSKLLQMNKPMKQLFKDQAKQEFFEENGYVTIPILEEKEVKELTEFYHTIALKDEQGYGFHISMDNVDKGLVKTIVNKIYAVALPKAQAQFIEAKPFVASYVIKESNPKGVVPVHQDWTFIENEIDQCSITCWIPLQDVTIDNGAMGVIKGSHRFLVNLRPSPSPQVPSPISEHMFTIFPYLKIIELKAGEALLFDNRTFHGSPPNTTSSPRLAVGIGFTQSQAQLCHYYLKPDGANDTVLKYKIDEGFFQKYENATLSKMYDRKALIEGYEMMGEFPFTLPKLTSEELLAMIKEAGNEFNVPLCEKLATLFQYNMDGTAKREEAQPEPVIEPKPTAVSLAEPKAWVWVDERPFLIKYSPLNIIREAKKRLFA